MIVVLSTLRSSEVRSRGPSARRHEDHPQDLSGQAEEARREQEAAAGHVEDEKHEQNAGAASAEGRFPLRRWYAPLEAAST